MSTLLYPTYALACAALLVFGIRLHVRRPHLSTAAFLVVTFGVLLDNAVLAMGNVVGEGDLLLALSVPRFVLHQLALPWLIYGSWDLARQLGQRWALHPRARIAALALTLGVMAAGALTRLAGLHLEPEVADGVLRYVAVGVAGPPIVSIVSVGFAGIVGIVAWRGLGWPWLALAAVAVFVAEALPDEALRRAIGSAFEVVFLAALLLTQQRADEGRLVARTVGGRAADASPVA